MENIYRKNLQRMEPYVPGRPIESVMREYGLTHVTKLASNENPRGFSPMVPDAVMRSLSSSHIYPDGYYTELRAAVSGFYNVNPKRLVFGCGSDDVIYMLGKILIEPGDECITGQVTFSPYAASVDSMDGVTVRVPMKDHSFDLEAIAARVTNRTKLIFIANPNNPTGTYISASQQADFLERIPQSVTVVIDEAYRDFADTPDFPDTWEAINRYDNVVLLKTFSKVYGLASFRVGFGVMSEEMAVQMEKVRMPFNVTTQGQAAAIAALNDTDYVEESRKLNLDMRKWTVEALEGMGFSVIPSQANFVTVDMRRDCTEVFKALMAKGYIVRPVKGFWIPCGDGSENTMKNFIRVTVGTREQMERFMGAFKSLYA